jgi:hypothetical protein
MDANMQIILINFFFNFLSLIRSGFFFMPGNYKKIFELYIILSTEE